MKQGARHREHRGFTIIELLVVVLIFGILAAITIPWFVSQRASARNAQVVSQAETLVKEAAALSIDHTGALSGDETTGQIAVASGPTSAVNTTPGVRWLISGTTAAYCAQVWSTSGATYTATAPFARGDGCTTQTPLPGETNGGSSTSPSSPPSDPSASPSTPSATNHPPVASFTLKQNGRNVTVDATASTDADGDPLSYAWTFGDGGTALGPTASYHYATDGTYTVTLSVADPTTGLDSATRQVSAAPAVVASDAFARTSAGGWGSADAGGGWTYYGSTSPYSTAGGIATQSLGTSGQTRWSWLTSATSVDTRSCVEVSVSKAGAQIGPSTAYVFVQQLGRQVGSDSYYGRLKFWGTGTVQLTANLTSQGSSYLALANLPAQYTTPGSWLHLCTEVTGTNPTTIRVKAWPDGQAEPGWQLTATNALSAMQAPGYVGLGSYLSSSGTGSLPPVDVKFRNYSVTSGN